MKCRTTILVEIGFDNWTKFCQSSLLLFLWSMVVQFELYTSRQFGNYRSFMWFHHQSVVQQGNSNPPQVPFIHRDFNKNAAFHLMHISGLFGPSRNHFKHLTLLGYIGSQNSTVTKVSTQINQKTPGQFYFRWGDSDGLVRRGFFFHRCFLIGSMGLWLWSLIFHHSRSCRFSWPIFCCSLLCFVGCIVGIAIKKW